MRSEAEEFDVEALPPPARAPRPDPASRPARSAIGWFICGLALVGAGVLITPAIGMTDRNIAPDLSDAPQQQWEIPLDSTGVGEGNVWIDSGHVVTASANAVRGVELASGEMTWEVRAPQLTCARDGEDIACVSRQGTRTELIELTASEGEVGRTVHPDLAAALPYDGDTFAVFETAETISVARWGSAGEHVWTHRTHVGDLPEPIGPGQVDVNLGVADGALLITRAPHAGGQMALDIVDGSPRTEITGFREHDAEWVVLKARGAWIYDRSGQPSPLAMTGWPLRVDDDPDAEAVFDVSDAGMTATSHRDGQVLWGFSPEPPSPVVPHARLDGTVVAWSEGAMHALDGQSGELLWRHDSPGPRCPCLGDGTTLAHVTGSEESILTGIDVATGQQIWEVPIAGARTVHHDTDGDHLAVYSAFGLSLWSLR